MWKVNYDVTLVEEAVCRAARDLPTDQQRLFRRGRDRIYELPDERERETCFRRLHGEWFARLGLGRPVEHALATHPDVLAGVRSCRVIPVVSQKEEFADLHFDAPDWPSDNGKTSGGAHKPILILRMQLASLLDVPRLIPFLHRELLHVADMLDPAFGYQKALACSEDGPSRDNILRDRYRVLWDTTIDGRQLGAGLVSADAREVRLAEFARAFPECRSSLERQFARWFEGPRPTHQEMAAFALTSGRSAGTAPPLTDGRCPVCRFPVAVLDPAPERLSPAARRAIQAAHPYWDVEAGLCSQCADLYDVRYREI
jgi:hypothetical protein